MLETDICGVRSLCRKEMCQVMVLCRKEMFVKWWLFARKRDTCAKREVMACCKEKEMCVWSDVSLQKRDKKKKVGNWHAANILLTDIWQSIYRLLFFKNYQCHAHVEASEYVRCPFFAYLLWFSVDWAEISICPVLPFVLDRFVSFCVLLSSPVKSCR